MKTRPTAAGTRHVHGHGGHDGSRLMLNVLSGRRVGEVRVPWRVEERGMDR